MSAFRTGARSLAVRVGHRATAGAVFRSLDRLPIHQTGVLAVLTYHRVDEPDARPWLYPPLISATPAGFESQMKMLLRHYRPVSLAEVLSAVAGDSALPPRAVLVTFDDAYRDFADNAWPVLRSLAIPVVLFVPTAHADAAGPGFWWDRLWSAIGLPEAGTPDERRKRRAMELIERHKLLPHEEAMASVDRLTRASLGGRWAGLGWADLRDLSGDGVTLAPHSRSHPLLTKVSGPALVDEIVGSRADLLREVPDAGGETAFAYPAGANGPREVSALASAGFQVAFTTSRGVNRIGRTHPLRLHRINVSLAANPRLIMGQLVLGALRRRVLER